MLLLVVVVTRRGMDPELVRPCAVRMVGIASDIELAR